MQTALTYRTNRDLFSNYYLDEHLPETEEWDELSDDELREAKADIMELWEREKGTAPKRNESQLEEKFIRPMFRKLGIPFEVEESTSRTQRRPDYGFFESDDAARDAFERREKGGDFYKDAVAVADAKRWGRPLDTRGSGEHERDFENPSYQIHVYLQEVDDARWAVLTDGKKWRLYYGPTSHRLDSYYEIDLPTVLEKGDLEDFKYFYLFFRHGAFLEDSSGDCFLDDVYGESNVFAQELGEDLQDNIYEAIKILSEGYLQYPENDLGEDDLDLIHDSSLIYLYRLIFVLYAEAEGRELLDTSNEIYEQSYSLNSLKQEIAEEIDSGDPKYRDWQDDLESRLDELFTLIDKGSKSRGIPEEDLYIPAYNGGLFRTDPDEDDSEEAKFLANHDVGDAYLAKVIELLTRSKNGNGGGKIFVDYSSLDVRHLGSIYEGLLEYQLNVADEQLSLDDGEYVSADEDDDIVVQEGEVYLTTGSGERKATGSYYTPEYVVEYIVENTLEPLVDDIRADLAGRSAHGEDRGFAEEFAERIFDLKILDPAMGSGHFLTSAIDYLAREIIDAQEKQAAQQGIETVNQEHDINWARRQVAQRCIYGVDLNPLAVELAKVSLWLRTLAAEQPLAFLDHHLKTGNSLVGSDIEEIEELESESGGDEQNASLADFGVARKGTIEQLMRIYEDFIAIENQELADVKEMEDKYDEIEQNQLRQRLEAMANVRTARDFGLDHTPEDVFEDMSAALEDDAEWEEIASEEWFEDAQTWAENQDYFHWKLEFPEVFYTADGDSKVQGGFDAVIGNPPYIIFKMLSDDIRDYYRSNFDSFEMKGDVYVLFLELASDLLRDNGHTGYIIQNKFTKAKYGSSIRDYLSSQETVREIIDFHDSPVFDITAYPMILLRQKVPPEEDHKFTWRDIRESEKKQIESELFGGEAGWTITQSDLGSDVWHPFVSDDVVTANTIPIEEFADQIGQGAIPGNTEVYIVDDEVVEENDLEQEYIEQVLRGGDVNQFIMESPQNLSQLIYPYDVVDGEPELATPEQIPNILSYLEDFKSDLVERKNYGKKLVDQGYEWYELRYEAPGMLNEKIVFPDISPENRFAYDRNGEFACLDTVYYLVRGDDLTTYDSRYLTAILNSALLDYLFDRMSPKVRGGYRRYKTQYVESLPVPAVDFTARRHINENTEDSLQTICEDVSVGDSSVNEALEDLNSLGGYKVVLHDTLCKISDSISDIKVQRRSYNLELMDYLGSYEEGEKLGEFHGYQPASGVSKSFLTETTETKDNLRFGDVRVLDEGHKVVIEASARYKPESPEEFETDQWGYTETEYTPVMEFVGVGELETALLVEFVEYATEEGDGFAGFRDTATKRNSLVNRLEDLVLPDLSDVESGLESYLEKKREVSELDEEYNRLYDLLNRLVYELYELEEDKIKMVESTR